MNAVLQLKSPNTPKRFWKALAAGLITSIGAAAIMAIGMKTGVSPLPKPLGLAFAEWVLGRALPLPIGLLFHLAYVTGWSVLFIMLAPARWLRFWPILGFGLTLWLLAIFVFTPLVGWGIAATAVAGPKGIVATLVAHLLFVFFLWLSCRWLFRSEASGKGKEPSA
jgi:hypothetical protein